MPKQKKQHWLEKNYDLEGWLHKHFLYEDHVEFLIFLAWGLFVTVFLLSLYQHV